MKSYIFFIILVCTLSACEKEKYAAPAYVPPPPPNNSPAKTWLALGDSYTIGQSVSAGDRFATQTVNRLRQNGINISTPDYIATTGWTSTTLFNAISSINPTNHDVVSLLIGVNDQYQTHDTVGYRIRFTTLLNKAIQLANGKKENVFVLSIPDYSVTPFASSLDTAKIRKELDWFNAINKSVTNSYNCPYLDITASTREAKFDVSLLAVDGLHPSGIEYAKWANRLLPLMLPVLR